MRRTVKADGLHAFRNSQPTQPAEVARIMVMIRIAYERLKSGGGSEADFDRVGAALNIGLIRAESIGQPLVEAFKHAGEAMLESVTLCRKHGKFGFSGPGLLHMNAGMDLYEEVLALSSPNQMEAAAQEGAARIRRGHFTTA
jgi:hypothetical protein